MFGIHWLCYVIIYDNTPIRTTYFHLRLWWPYGIQVLYLNVILCLNIWLLYVADNFFLGRILIIFFVFHKPVLGRFSNKIAIRPIKLSNYIFHGGAPRLLVAFEQLKVFSIQFIQWALRTNTSQVASISFSRKAILHSNHWTALINGKFLVQRKVLYFFEFQRENVSLRYDVLMLVVE